MINSTISHLADTYQSLAIDIIIEGVGDALTDTLFISLVNLTCLATGLMA